MTEADWLACSRPASMLNFLSRESMARRRTSDRKLRLFAVACCRRIWHLLPDQRCRKAVQTAEDFADGKGGIRLLRKVENAGEFYYDHWGDAPGEGLGSLAGGAIFQL